MYFLELRAEPGDRFEELYHELSKCSSEEEAFGVIFRYWNLFNAEEQAELQKELMKRMTPKERVVFKEKIIEKPVYRTKVVEKKVYVEKPYDPNYSTPAEHLLTHKMHVLKWKVAGVIAVLLFIIVMLIVKR